MLSTGNKSHSFNKDMTLPELNLRALRSKIFRHYNQSEKAEDLTALLLYFALFWLSNKKDLALLFRAEHLVNKALGELTEHELFFLGHELIELLNDFLPKNITGVMVIPDKVAWLKAKELFIGISKDILFTDIADLGFIYQIFNSIQRKEKALPALQKANKSISKAELINFTQLYTPNWVVDFLVANTFMSISNIPGNKISRRYARWLIPSEPSIGYVDPIILKNFSVIDPACGSGQFLFSAFDLMMDLYKSSACESGLAAKLILEQNLFGADIDEKAIWVGGLGLLIKYLLASDSLKEMPGRLNNLAWIMTDDSSKKNSEASFLGSIDNRLDEKHFLKNKFSVILTNPPYIGRRCLSRELKAELKKQYPNSSSDIAVAFLDWSLGMLKENGRLGVITQSSVLSIPSYKSIREYLVSQFQLSGVVYCGPGVFPLASGEKIDSVLLLVNASQPKQKTCFIDLSSEKSKDSGLADILSPSSKVTEMGVEVDQNVFLSGIPNKLLSRLSKDFYTKLGKLPKLADIAEIRQGLATTDNGRFVRYRFDIEEESLGKTWVPYVKGAGGERYASDNPFVVKWGENGQEIKQAVAIAYPYLKGKTAWVVKNEEYYFRPGLCFSFINKTGLAVRKLPAGAIFDVASSAIFVAPEEEDFLLAYLNARVIGLITKGINQTINIQVGDLKKIPIILLSSIAKNEISQLGRAAFEIKSELINFHLQLPSFDGKSLGAAALAETLAGYLKRKMLLQDRLADVQEKIDMAVMGAMEKQGLVNQSESNFLQRSLFDLDSAHTNARNKLTEKQAAYKLVYALVAQSLISREGDRVVVLSPDREKSILELFNLTLDGMQWLESKIEMSMHRMLASPQTFDFGKLALEPSRYFSFYLPDHNVCMLFSAAAAKRYNKNERNLYLVDSNVKNLTLLKELKRLWKSVFEQLDKILDWTSKDLEKLIKLKKVGF